MTENDPFPEIKVINYSDPIDKLTKLLHFIFDRYHCPPASHGSHFEHPLDTPIQPVTDWPTHGKAEDPT